MCALLYGSETWKLFGGQKSMLRAMGNGVSEECNVESLEAIEWSTERDSGSNARPRGHTTILPGQPKKFSLRH